MKSRMYPITASEMHAVNRAAVLDLICREGPISRAAIARALNVSLPTVLRIVDRLSQEGLLRFTGTMERSGGRRRELIEFNTHENIAIGVDLGGTKVSGVVVDLGGQTLHDITISRHNSQGEASYQRLVELIETLLEFARQTGLRLLGIGVGAPGVTFPDEGVVQWAPSLNWRDFPLKARLKEQFNLPVVVDNDVNLAALGEYWFGVAQNYSNLVLVTVGTGIGAGVIIDGAIYRGSHYSAGEIGYLIPDRSALDRSYTAFGALEQLASGIGIAARARQALKGSRSASELDKLDAEEVFNAARRGEVWAQQIVAETVDYLAMAVAALDLCLDPDIIILGGGVAHSADLLIAPIIARLKDKLPKPVNLIASQLGSRSTALGAMVHLLRDTSNLYVVRRW